MIELDYIREWDLNPETKAFEPSLVVKLRVRGDDVIYMYKNEGGDTVQIGVKFSRSEYTVKNDINEIESMISLDRYTPIATTGCACRCGCSKSGFYDIPTVFTAEPIYKAT